ncbi:unnamed protein product [Prunus armeniaca]
MVFLLSGGFSSSLPWYQRISASLSQREPGKLLSQVIPNPNEGHKTAKAITLRSGNKVEKDDNEERNSTKNVAAPSPKLTVPSDNSKVFEFKEGASFKGYPIDFPKSANEYFLLDAFQQILSYAKFLK